MTSNRNPMKQFFITFPQSGNIDKSMFRDKLLRFDPDYYKVCQEEHKDGLPHLHAVIRFKNKYSKAFILKYFKEIYPNDYKRIDVQAVRSIKKALQYLSKEDQSPLESGEYQDNRDPQRYRMDKFAREFGYSNTESLLVDLQRELEDYEDKRRKILDQYHYFLKYYPDQKLLYDDQKIVNKLLDEIRISKDDMTKILKVINIK